MAKKIVWVLTIEQRHGRDSYERKTAAKAALFVYVTEFWEEPARTSGTYEASNMR